MIRIAACEQRKQLVRFVRMIRSQSSGVISKMSLGWEVPALLTRMSSRPNWPMAALNSCSAPWAVLTSAWTATARRPCPAIIATTSSAGPRADR